MNKIFLSLTTPKTKRTPKQKMKNKLEIVIEEDRVHVLENNFPIATYTWFCKDDPSKEECIAEAKQTLEKYRRLTKG